MGETSRGGGPLAGVRVVEMAGLGALPFGVLKLADMGADVIRVDRASAVPDAPAPEPLGPWDRGRRSIAVDLKRPGAAEVVLRLAAQAEVLVESFRPGVMERLGLGPAVVLARRPSLVYGRLTGWGQTGPLAAAAGHSLNYEAITGVVRAVGPRGGPPVPALQVLGDFAGGGLHLAYGVVCALVHARATGEGQVVDVAMSDGVASLVSTYYAMDALGMHGEDLGTNLFDGGAPFYGVYETRDGRYVTVAAVEPHFWALLLERLGIDAQTCPDQHDRTAWPATRARLSAVFRQRTRDEWARLLEGTDVCVAPVLTFGEARHHPHNVARGLFEAGRLPAVRPVPRLEGTPGRPGPSPRRVGADTDAVLRDHGYRADEIRALRDGGVVR